LGARPEVNSALIPEPEALSPLTNPAAALQAVMNFLAQGHILSGDEFFRIRRKSQNSGRRTVFASQCSVSS